MPGVCWVFLTTLVSPAGRARAHMCVFINLSTLSLPYVSQVPGARHQGRVTHVQSWCHTTRQTAATRACSIMLWQIKGGSVVPWVKVGARAHWKKLMSVKDNFILRSVLKKIPAAYTHIVMLHVWGHLSELKLYHSRQQHSNETLCFKSGFHPTSDPTTAGILFVLVVQNSCIKTWVRFLWLNDGVEIFVNLELANFCFHAAPQTNVCRVACPHFVY